MLPVVVPVVVPLVVLPVVVPVVVPLVVLPVVVPVVVPLVVLPVVVPVVVPLAPPVVPPVELELALAAIGSEGGPPAGGVTVRVLMLPRPKKESVVQSVEPKNLPANALS